MATDIATNYSGNFDEAYVPDTPMGQPVIRTRYFDASSENLAATEYKIMRIPAGATVWKVRTNVQTAEGAGTLLDIGTDGGTATDFETDVDLNVTGITESSDDIIHVTSADWITITPAGALDAAKFYITVYYDMESTTQALATKLNVNN
jgi:hypothetical protein